MAELSLRERCEKRLGGLKEVRYPYEPDWREIASYAMPARSRFLSSGKDKNRRATNRNLQDGHGIIAARTLTGGMTSGLSSPSRPWFRLTMFDEDMNDDQDVKDWLGEVERRLYEFFNRARFYDAAKAGYTELGLFGAEAGVMIEHSGQGAVCHALTAGEYWIAQNDALMADSLYRSVPMTVLQVFQMFGKDNVSTVVRTAYDQGTYEQVVDVFHAIEPNFDADPGKFDSGNMAFRSLWWDSAEPDKKKLLRFSGTREQPFWAPRWDTVGGDVWGQSPGMDALPDLRELQMHARKRGRAIDFAIDPEMVVGSNVLLRRQPKSTVAAAGPDAGAAVSVPYPMPYQVIGLIREEINETKQAVDEAFYADLFLAITNMQGIQPRNVEEIAARNEEKLTQLGPVIERVNAEKLQVAIDRALGIMARGGLLPPAPRSIQGQPIKTEFVSILAQMQRMVGMGQIERVTSFVGNLAAAHPDVLDVQDFDATVREYADRAGMPAKLIRSEADVQKMRAERAAQQKTQQMLASLPAVKDGAQAAQLLSQTDTGGGRNALQALGGQ